MAAADDELLDDVAAVRRLVELGRQARAASKLQHPPAAAPPRGRGARPRRALRGRDRRRAAGEGGGASGRWRPPSCGCARTSRCSARAWAPSSASCARRWRPASSRRSTTGGFRVAGHDLGPDEVLVERTEKEGWAVAASDGATVALDLELDDELRLEGRVYDLIHHVNSLRKEQGLALTDRIDLRLPAARRRPARARRLDRARDARRQRRGRRRGRGGGAAQPGVTGGRGSPTPRAPAPAAAAAGDRQDDQHQPPSPSRPSTRRTVAATSQREADSRSTAKRPRAGQRRRPNRERLGSGPASNSGSASPSSRGPSGDSSVMALRSSAR